MSTAQPSRSILIVSYDFPPRAVRTAVRAANIARFLAKNEWRVHVVCCAPDGTVRRDEVWASQLEQDGIIINRAKPLKRVEVLPNGSIRTSNPRLLKLQRWFKQWSMQPDVYAPWRKSALRSVEQIIADESINILLAVAPPFSDFTLVQDIAERTAIPFAVDYGDVWLDNPEHSYPTPMHRNGAAQMEQELLRKAAVILSTTRRTKEDLLRRFRFLNHEEIMIVPHGFDEEEFSALVQEPNEKLVITAYQDFHLDTSPKPMFKALRGLLNAHPELRSRVQLNIIGIVRENHRSLLRKWKLQDVVHVNMHADRPQALEIVANSTLLWYSSPHDSAAASAIVGDYLGARKPLLMTCPKGTKLSTAAEYTRVFHSEENKPKDIAGQLELIFRAWTEHSLAIPATQLAKCHSLNYATTLREVSRMLGMSMKL